MIKRYKRRTLEHTYALFKLNSIPIERHSCSAYREGLRRGWWVNMRSVNSSFHSASSLLVRLLPCSIRWTSIQACNTSSPSGCVSNNPIDYIQDHALNKLHLPSCIPCFEDRRYRSPIGLVVLPQLQKINHASLAILGLLFKMRWFRQSQLTQILQNKKSRVLESFIWTLKYQTGPVLSLYWVSSSENMRPRSPINWTCPTKLSLSPW
jgi:hypothetical protein